MCGNYVQQLQNTNATEILYIYYLNMYLGPSPQFLLAEASIQASCEMLLSCLQCTV